MISKKSYIRELTFMYNSLYNNRVDIRMSKVLGTLSTLMLKMPIKGLRFLILLNKGEILW